VHAKRLQIFGVSNARMTPTDRAEAMRGFARDMLPMFADGRIVPLVDKVFPFEELPAAKGYVEGNAQVGKVVVRFT
jgi:NADPH:quinone reductase-like Zn-dependent oxidoreductase